MHFLQLLLRCADFRGSRTLVDRFLHYLADCVWHWPYVFNECITIVVIQLHTLCLIRSLLVADSNNSALPLPLALFYSSSFIINFEFSKPFSHRRTWRCYHSLSDYLSMSYVFCINWFFSSFTRVCKLAKSFFEWGGLTVGSPRLPRQQTETSVNGSPSVCSPEVWSLLRCLIVYSLRLCCSSLHQHAYLEPAMQAVHPCVVVTEAVECEAAVVVCEAVVREVAVTVHTQGRAVRRTRSGRYCQWTWVGKLRRQRESLFGLPSTDIESVCRLLCVGSLKLEVRLHMWM